MIHPVLQSLGNAERGAGVPVVLLTGADRLSLDAVAFSLADSCPSICSIAYDVRPNAAVESGLDIVRTITRPRADDLAFGKTDSFALEECCMSCTVKHDVGRVLKSICSAFATGVGVGSEVPPRIESNGLSDAMGISASASPESLSFTMPEAFLVSLPVGLEGSLVAQYLTDLFRLDDWSMPLFVGVVANAVGLDEFEERFFDDDRLCLYGLGEEDGVYDERSTGAVVSRLIRESSCVLELPVVGAGCLARHLDADGECRCRDIIRAIADCDALICEDAHTVSLMELVGVASGATVPRV
ncbi:MULTISPECIES: hypothetical protein [unclassified Bifidobacterium]|uniref:hypothetical protein n=1 Tax=unclassified Bifidobacterium TaxID=2608897 RepID=UPI001DFA1A1D|nr:MULTISPECIES: hypothetical protein [unclassified Bifidobacterium]TPF77667.1 hypothetical protein BW09_08715 [Bifidobacterium sp. UTCIF-1]TPF79518.1 hypothetical protein BW08_09540 [Bifidobacterium sp. UTCIF-24]TPF81780.1 hypothetical protein BW12_08005 [Bifidobacterium sp. UTCIF-3]TPF83534.1 hypothetical protein BW07_09765 [Bifidobacterium sp. UTCIF-36]TPF88303.1 hypothetical protein BW10_10070 [Bifidobacterium sp. UTBIF-56]